MEHPGDAAGSRRHPGAVVVPVGTLPPPGYYTSDVPPPHDCAVAMAALVSPQPTPCTHSHTRTALGGTLRTVMLVPNTRCSIPASGPNLMDTL
jgi:hypothetical protein